MGGNNKEYPLDFSVDDIKIVRSRRRRTCALIVGFDGTVTMRIPLSMPGPAAGKLALSRMDWIMRKRRLALEEEARRLKMSAGVPYLGKIYKLSFLEGGNAGFSFHGFEFRLGGALRGSAFSLLGEWYRRRAELIIGARLGHYASRAGIRHAGFSLSNARRRWGACGGKGRLRFNWRLIMAPLFAVDYVVAHELAHLRRRDHSSRFWSEVSRIMPAYREGRAWLKANGRSLFPGPGRIFHSA